MASHPAAPALVKDWKRFVERVMQPEFRPDLLTPLESRLLTITQTFLVNALIMARVDGQPPGQILPLNAETMARGARLALAAAIEVEQPLRQLRDSLEG